MHLRHIRPRSVEWQDAQSPEAVRATELDPEQVEKLRILKVTASKRLSPAADRAGKARPGPADSTENAVSR